jgi:hypothetical protein
VLVAHGRLFVPTHHEVSGRFSVNPRENRLTEVTAAVLELVHGVTAAFIAGVLGAGIDDAQRRDLGPAEHARRRALLADFISLENPRVSVTTQLATRGGRFVDLELLLRPGVGAQSKGLLLWVEIKHGAGLHGDQLDAYLERELYSRLSQRPSGAHTPRRSRCVRSGGHRPGARDTGPGV